MPSQSSTHILVVDDDPQVRRLLRRCFEEEGYRITEAPDADAVRRQTLDGIGLITLDLNLKGEDGLQVAREIRSRSDVPIIMVTGKGDTIDRVVGLELGADDYITKPFHLREVLARVKTVLRRSGGRDESPAPAATPAASGGGAFRFEGWTADFVRMELRRADGVPCTLTTGELRLLEVLVTHANRVLSRDQLMDLLKGRDSDPLDRSIDNQIARLRKKIEADPKNPTLIRTLRGAGYKFTAEVRPAG